MLLMEIPNPVPQGRSQRRECILRWTLEDGRTVDDGPFPAIAAGAVRSGMMVRLGGLRGVWWSRTGPHQPTWSTSPPARAAMPPY